MLFTERLNHCECCPRHCGVDRLAGEAGFCRIPVGIQISHAGLHFGEEPPLSGTRGSGTIFFAGCNLRCVFCQNYQISQEFAQQPDLAADQRRAVLDHAAAAGRGGPQYQLRLSLPHDLPDGRCDRQGEGRRTDDPGGVQLQRLRRGRVPQADPGPGGHLPAGPQVSGQRTGPPVFGGGRLRRYRPGGNRGDARPGRPSAGSMLRGWRRGDSWCGIWFCPATSTTAAGACAILPIFLRKSLSVSCRSIRRSTGLATIPASTGP